MFINNDLQAYNNGFKLLAGVDEVGRGPFAGPVVSAAVILKPETEIIGLDDSKKLTERRREQLNPIIKDKAITWGIGLASVEEIAQFNILNATFLAMQRAVEQLKMEPDYVLVDGKDFPKLIYSGKELVGNAIIKGESHSKSIAAASVIAKVYRDNLMVQYAQKYPLYGFEQHKGYGSADHRRAILEHGPCPIHRPKFIKNTLQKGKV